MNERTKKPYPQSEFISCPVWARLKLKRSVAADVFGIIYGLIRQGKECYMSTDDFAFLIQCDNTSVTMALRQLKGLPYKRDKNGNYKPDIMPAVIGIKDKRDGKSNFYEIKQDVVDQWIADWKALIEIPEKQTPRKKSKQPPQSEPETEFEKILTDKGSSEPQSFAPNSLDEVQTYWREQGFTKSSPKEFYDYYNSDEHEWFDDWHKLGKAWERNQKPKKTAPKKSQNFGVQSADDANEKYKVLVNDFDKAFASLPPITS